MRLDQYLVERKMAASRSQAIDFIKRQQVILNGNIIQKANYQVKLSDKISLVTAQQYVSRAGHKLASVVKVLKIDFKSKIVLDVGSSTGGFSDFALQNGASLVVAVDVGSHQIHPSLLNNQRLELHEKTDIRNFKTKHKFDLVIIDVSFVSLRQILPSLIRFCQPNTLILAMFKPQFEAFNDNLKHKGVIKNETMRRQIIKNFEIWLKTHFLVIGKTDSALAGQKGNLERFYLLKLVN